MPPRQLSVNGEHGFPRHPFVGRVRVFVNGDMLRNVIAYDIDAGWVEAIIHDDRGQPVRTGDGWQVARHYGAVKVALQ
jgi:hypothetical protein